MDGLSKAKVPPKAAKIKKEHTAHHRFIFVIRKVSLIA
jgi:hypothetical protein